MCGTCRIFVFFVFFVSYIVSSFFCMDNFKKYFDFKNFFNHVCTATFNLYFDV